MFLIVLILIITFNRDFNISDMLIYLFGRSKYIIFDKKTI